MEARPRLDVGAAVRAVGKTLAVCVVAAVAWNVVALVALLAARIGLPGRPRVGRGPVARGGLRAEPRARGALRRPRARAGHAALHPALFHGDRVARARLRRRLLARARSLLPRGRHGVRARPLGDDPPRPHAMDRMARGARGHRRDLRLLPGRHRLPRRHPGRLALRGARRRRRHAPESPRGPVAGARWRARACSRPWRCSRSRRPSSTLRGSPSSRSRAGRRRAGLAVGLTLAATGGAAFVVLQLASHGWFLRCGSPSAATRPSSPSGSAERSRCSSASRPTCSSCRCSSRT